MTRELFLLRAGLAAALLGTTAVTGAFAQNSQITSNRDVKTCNDLRATLEQHAELIKTDQRADATKMVGQGDDQKCADFYKQAAVNPDLTAQPAGQQDQTAQSAGQTPAQQPNQQDQTAQVAAQGQIVVTQPNPTVTVEQTAPEVAVLQQQPQVTVNQGQPQIEVHQAQPVIHVQMPQPVITIDQPQPQIIVRMPNPQVAVNAPTPQIEVRQAPPKVTVQQAQPQVQVLGESDQTAGNAKVNVEQQQPKVVQQAAEGQPNVQVQPAQPKVQYFPAQPKVQVEALGEPQVKFNQSGQPDIRIEQLQGAQEVSSTEAGANQQPGANQPPREQMANSASQQAQQTNAQPAQQGSGQQVASTNQSGNAAGINPGSGANASTALLLLPDQQQAMEAGQPKTYEAPALVGQPVSNWKGDNLGTVDRIATDGTRQFIVLAPDTPLGDGQKGVILPLETLSFADGKLVMRGMTNKQITDLASVDTTKLKDIQQGQQLNVATR